VSTQLSNLTLVWASLGFFVAFLAVAAIDGIYFHFKRFRLWAHAESRLEHALHTARAFAMPPMIAGLFLPGPFWLVVAIVFVVLDEVAAGLDVAVEWKSRRPHGGLPQGEYIAHLVATTFHIVAVTLAFVAKAMPAAETSPYILPIVGVLVIGTSLGAIQHAILCAKGADSMAREAV
jgi:hypothetical protein